MKIYEERALVDFGFWGGAEDHAKKLTPSELAAVEQSQEDIYPEGIDETTLNDIFHYDFDWVCESLGYTYEDCEVIREPREEEEAEEGEDYE